MKFLLKRFVFALTLLCLPPVGSAAPSWLLPSGFPQSAEHGLEVMREPALQEAMRQFVAFEQQGEAALFIIQHGGEAGDVALAAQLRDWLLMLGMQAQAIRFQRVRKLDNQLRIFLDQ